MSLKNNPNPSLPSPNQLKITFFLAISLLGFIIYANAFNSEFVFDTKLHFASSQNFKSGNPFDPWSIFRFAPYRFIGILPLAINHSISGSDVFGYQITNLTIHILNSIGTFWLVLLLLSTPKFTHQSISKDKDWIAFFIALIFLSHPVQTQGVTYTIQRLASLATFFYIFSLCFFIKARILHIQINGQSKSGKFFILSFLFAFFGMFTKEIVFTLPIMGLLIEIIFLTELKKIQWKYIPILLLIILIIPVIYLSLLPTVIFENKINNKGEEITSLIYILTQSRVIVTYLRLLFSPVNQQIDYDYPLSQSFLELPVIFGFLLILFIPLVTIQMLFRYKIFIYPAFGVLWFFIALSVESSFIPIADVIFEHRLYLPMVGFSIFFVTTLYYKLYDRKPVIFLTILIIVILAFSVLTIHRNHIWRTGIRLWTDQIEKAPANPRAYANRGIHLKEKGELEQAILDLNSAINLYPKFAHYWSIRSQIHFQMKNFDGCVNDLTRAIELDLANEITYSNRGVCFQKKEMLNEALSDFSKALEYSAKFAPVYANRFQIYMKKGNFLKALEDLKKARDLGYKVENSLLKSLEQKAK